MTLREWGPLTDLLSKLPMKIQSGIFQQEVKLTCVDALPEFIALGTNIGVIYWFDRKKKEMQRLRCENSNSPITALKIISTVDFMVACGNKLGNISIFQIPKSHPDNLPENLKPKNKQVERYTVTDLHKTPISALEWSKNGMKLFSGDTSGCVVLTEIDFYMHICKSVEILNETYEVVQLSYNQQRLLISTTYRSIICQKIDKWKVCQIGKKDRKILGNFGGIILQHSYKTCDTYLYCTRPGLRIWIADIEGNVQKTLLFKDILIKECPEVPVLNPIAKSLRYLKPQKEPAFGILLQFNDKLLITYNNDIVYILDPKEMTVLCTVNNLRGVLNVATSKDEIFILEEERSLIRISYRPESFCASNLCSPINTSHPLDILKDLGSKLQSTSILPIVPPEESLIIKAEEAVEIPEAHIKKEFNEIGKEDFSDKILFKKSKHRKKKSIDTSTISISSNSSEEKDVNYTQPTIMNLSTVGILPDLRSPESIKCDIEYKEKILADVLSFDKIKNLPLKIEEQDPLASSSNENTDNSVIEEKSITKFVEIPYETTLIKDNTRSECSGSLSLDAQNIKNGDPPACINIPSEWKLNSIQLRDRHNSNISDHSLSDWEIV